MARMRFTKSVEAEVLTKCRRRCALCFGLKVSAKEKDGQLAHIDRDSSNATIENAVFLCTTHHSRYDSRSRQTKGFTPDELRIYQRLLHEHMAAPPVWPDASGPTGRTRAHRLGVSLEVYERRIPIYRITNQFIRGVLQDLKPDLQLILKFTSDTDEALFLFDETVANYLALIFKRAFRLRTINVMRNGVPADYRTKSLADEEIELAVWFSEQFEEVRKRFSPFLRLK